MRVCIVSGVNLKHMTLVSLYTDRLARDGVEFDVVYHDRYGVPEEAPQGGHLIVHRGPFPRTSRPGRILNLLVFAWFARRVVRRDRYDFVVVWNDVAIALLGPWLRQKWAGRYCLNIRDYFFEKIPAVRRRFAKTIAAAAFTTISSDGFRAFLPEADYLTVLSMNLDVLRNVEPRTRLRAASEPITIGFVGNVRFFDLNQALLTVFANDPRFRLAYFGTNAEVLAEYASRAGIKNAVFHGAFPVSETSRFLGECDMINNLYGNKSIALDTALSIKLFHGAFVRIPILGVSQTYTEELLDEYGIGLSVSPDAIDATLPDRVYSWYRNLDFSTFNAGCQRLLEAAEHSQELLELAYRRHITAEVAP